MAIRCPRCGGVQTIICRGCAVEITEQPCCGARLPTLLDHILRMRDQGCTDECWAGIALRCGEPGMSEHGAPKRLAMTDDELGERFPLVEVGVRHRVVRPTVSDWATHDSPAMRDGLGD